MTNIPVRIPSRSTVEEPVNSVGSQEQRSASVSVPFIYKFITNWLITDPDILTGYEGIKRRRNYQVQNYKEMKYIYIFGGRGHIVKQKPINVGTFILIIVPGILYLIFESKWVWHHLSPALPILTAYFWLLCMLLFIKASTSDPGQLPRNIHLPTLPDPHTHKIESPPQEYFNMIKLPYYQDDKIGVTVRYCPTCHIWKPPRTSHCSTCNVCIKIHDHHCSFLNNCIGYRNYQYFLWLTLVINISCVFIIVQGFIHVFHYRIVTESTMHSFSQSISRYPVAFLLAIWGLLSLPFPLALMILHVYLTAHNITTREFLNYVVGKQQPDFVNVFESKSKLHNLFTNWISRPGGNRLVMPTDVYDKDDIRYQHIEPLQSFQK